MTPLLFSADVIHASPLICLIQCVELSASQPHHQLGEQVRVIVFDVEGWKLHRAIAVGYRHNPDHLKGKSDEFSQVQGRAFVDIAIKVLL